MFGPLWASTPKNTQGISNLILFYIGFCVWGAELQHSRNGLLYSNGYTLCKFTLSYTDYTYNILYNKITSEYITSIICITSLHVSIRLL